MVEHARTGSDVMADESPASARSGFFRNEVGRARMTTPPLDVDEADRTPATGRSANRVLEGYTDPRPTIRVVAKHEEPPANAVLPLITDADSAVAASFRVLRHRIRRELNGPCSIAVTSASPGEGKTTCAVNLAMALAEHGQAKVLLVDANLRAPRLGAALGFLSPSCFARQMAVHRNDPSAPWEVVAAFFPNLHVLAIDPKMEGQWVMNGPMFKEAMRQLGAVGYSNIIIDCPSALGSADVNIIEDSADGVLLTAIGGRTTGESLTRAARHLEPANIFGVVLLDAW